MKPIPRKPFASPIAYAVGALALTFGITACVPAPDSTPAPTPTPRPTVAVPAPAPSPVPTYESWMDAPRTPGDWRYVSGAQTSSAAYGTGSTPIEAALVLTCNRADGTIAIARTVRGPNTGSSMTVRTETTDRTLAARPQVSQNPLLMAQLAARDPLLDAMALTKGRFAIESPGQPTLYIPAWAEVTRVIEDCR